MKGYLGYVTVAMLVVLIGLSGLARVGVKTEAPSASSPLPTPRRLAASAPISSSVQVTMTAAGMWVTYVKDGEGTPISPGVFAQDITTGDMWFLSGGHAVKVSITGQWVTYRAADFGYAPPRYFTAVALDEQGNAWLGMYYPTSPSDPRPPGGVIKIAPDGTWTDYTSQLNGSILEIVADRSGNKWFFERDYITRFDGVSWQTDAEVSLQYLIEQNYADILTTIDRGYRVWYAEAPDRVWCFDWLIGQGVNVYDGSQWTTYTPQDGLAHEVVVSMDVDSHHKKWFSTWVGVSVLNDNGTLDKGDDVWTTYDLGLLSGYYGDIAIDQNDQVWLATDGALYMWNGQVWSRYDTANSGLPANYIGDILIDDENVKWFGTSAGLTKLIEHPFQVFLPLAMQQALP
jgi:hypothetical protein